MKHEVELKGAKGVRTAFPKRLVLAYQITNLTPSEVSRRTAISVTALSNYKRGKQLPSPDNITKLAIIFGTTEKWLYGMDHVSTPTRRILPKGIDPAHVNLKELFDTSTPDPTLIASSSIDASDTGINMFAYRIRGDDTILAKVAALNNIPRVVTTKEKHLLASAINNRFRELVGGSTNPLPVLAEATGLSATGLSHILRGFSWPRPITFYLLATALRTTPEVLESSALSALDTPKAFTREFEEAFEEVQLTDVEMQAQRLWKQAVKHKRGSVDYTAALARWQAYVLANVPQTIDIDSIDSTWLAGKPFHTITEYDGNVIIDFTCSDEHFEFTVIESLADLDRLLTKR